MAAIIEPLVGAGQVYVFTNLRSPNVLRRFASSVVAASPTSGARYGGGEDGKKIFPIGDVDNQDFTHYERYIIHEMKWPYWFTFAIRLAGVALIYMLVTTIPCQGLNCVYAGAGALPYTTIISLALHLPDTFLGKPYLIIGATVIWLLIGLLIGILIDARSTRSDATK